MKRIPVTELDSRVEIGWAKSYLYSTSEWMKAVSYHPATHRLPTEVCVTPAVIQHRWLPSWTPQINKENTILKPDYGVSSIQSKFQALVKKWKDETAHLSSPNDIAIHPAYQQIIGMGLDVLPLIFQELRDGGGRWHWALKAITGADPVPETDRGKVHLIKSAWLKWAEGRYL